MSNEKSHSTNPLPGECEPIQYRRQWHIANESEITWMEGSEWGRRPHTEDKINT